MHEIQNSERTGSVYKNRRPNQKSSYQRIRQATVWRDRIKNPIKENLVCKYQVGPRAARIIVGGLESMEIVTVSSGNI